MSAPATRKSLSFKENELGVMTYDKETNKFYSYFREKIKSEKTFAFFVWF